MPTTLAAESSVATVIQAMLPPGEAGVGLYLMVKIKASHFAVDDEDPDDIMESAVVHIVVERPTNYTKVWSCVNDSWSMPKPGDFTMRSDHDSCWRTDGLRDLSSAYLDVLTKVRDQLGTHPGRNKLSEFNVLDRIERVSLEWVHDEDNRHVKHLTKLEKA